MSDAILKKSGANFYGFENINSNGELHYNLAVIRGSGELVLNNRGIFFKEWITKNEYSIYLDKITKVEISSKHNKKMKWPGKVLRIYYQDKDEIKIFGVALGGKLSITKGWKDDAYIWKEKIELLLKEKF
ncbi:MAG: hypothetical protein KC550_01530 [Nanoarchaeota archaeon]|nr:hypothetical protein [Nanoarchaeota archaeon]